jgi:transposase, IS5 family
MRIQAAGGATRTKVRDRSRAIGAKLRSRSAAGRDEALAAVRRTTGELADLAERAAGDAERLLANATRSLRRARANATQLKAEGKHDAVAGRRRGRLARAVNDLSELVEATRQIAAQTRQRLRGQIPTAPPDGSACTTPTPARSPRAGSGSPRNSATRHKAQIVECDDGVIVGRQRRAG